MRIAIVRGPSLNQWEMQNYQPLAKKHEVLAIGSTKPLYDLSKIGLKTIRLRCLGQLLNYFPGGINFLYRRFGDPQYLLNLEKAICGFDIVHTAEIANGYSAQAAFAKKKGLVKKIVVTVWENIPFLEEEKTKRKALSDLVLSSADFFLAVGETAKDALLTKGAEEKKIKVIPMGVDLNKFRPARKNFSSFPDLKIKPEEFVILSVGRLVWEKGFQDLLLAVKKIAADQKVAEKKIRLIIVGQGPEKKDLLALKKRLGLDQYVTFIPSVPYEKINEIYHLADVFVLASIPTTKWKEQFGMVLIEAMASGLPIVATECGEIPNVLSKTGLLIPPGSHQSLTQALKKVILDQRYRQILSQRSRQRAEKNFNCHLTAQRIEELYQELMLVKE